MLDMHYPVRVLDADGFVHEIIDMRWSKEDQCYFLLTSYPEEPTE